MEEGRKRKKEKNIKGILMKVRKVENYKGEKTENWEKINEGQENDQGQKKTENKEKWESEMKVKKEENIWWRRGEKNKKRDFN